MERIGDAKDVAKHCPLTITIPKQDVMLINRDSSSDTNMHSRSEMHFCPAYRFCQKSKGFHRSPMLDNDHDQQITTLHNLLQAIKEAALKLIQLIESDIDERRKRDANSRVRYPDSARYEKHNQLHSPAGSGLILVTPSSSVCALCGVVLHMKDSSKESRQFVIDRERNDDYNRDITSKHLDNIFLKIGPWASMLAEKGKNSDNFLKNNSRSVLDYVLPKEEDSINIPAKEQEKIFSKIRSTDTSESGLKSKLLFIRRMPSERTTCQDESQRRSDKANQVLEYVSNDKIASKRRYNKSTKPVQLTQQSSRMTYVSPASSSTQDASTVTHEMFCPCMCGLLVRNRTESEISIESLPTLRDELIKSKLEELGLHLDSRAMHTKMHDDILNITKTKTQKLVKDINIKHWKEEVIELQLQMQIEELHKNIQFFKQENEYIRCLAEKCRFLSGKIKSLQQLLPIRVTYSELTIVIKQLQAKYYNKHGILATLTGMFQGSTNIQQIVSKLLAPFTEHWHRDLKDNVITTRVPSASRTKVPWKPSSSMVLNTY